MTARPRLRQDACRRHVEVLPALAEAAAVRAGARPGELAAAVETTPDAADARRHVAACPACRSTVEELALAILALHRLRPAGEPARSAGDGAWDRLRGTLERSRERARREAWRWKTETAGLLGSALLVGLLAAPVAVRMGVGAEPGGFSAVEATRHALAVEAAYDSRAGTLPPAHDDTLDASLRTLYTTRPDGLRPERKEVAPTRPTAHTPEAR